MIGLTIQPRSIDQSLSFSLTSTGFPFISFFFIVRRCLYLRIAFSFDLIVARENLRNAGIFPLSRITACGETPAERFTGGKTSDPARFQPLAEIETGEVQLMDFCGAHAILFVCYACSERVRVIFNRIKRSICRGRRENRVSRDANFFYV